jgi:hypothetical protein
MPEIDGLIVKTPCRGIKLPEEPEGEEMLFLNPVQVSTLAEAMNPRFRTLIRTAPTRG